MDEGMWVHGKRSGIWKHYDKAGEVTLKSYAERS